MKKLFFAFLILMTAVIYSQPEFSEIGSRAGAFSRMGFGARGMGMGNSMSAVTEGNLVSYYNPAAIVYQENNSFQTSYSFLSLDRSLNFLNFTRKFDFYSSKDTSVNRKPRSTAGVSIGIINAGVNSIPLYDNSGYKTGEASTSENMLFIGLANRFSDKLSVGIGVKFFYYKLYDKISANGIGLDLGGLYKLNERWNISFMISDINSKYKWDSSPIYNESGSNFEDKFPLLKKIGVAYKNEKIKLLVTAELESSNAQTNILRIGAEYNIYGNFFIRGGMDQFNVSNKDFPVKPAAGFSYSDYFGSVRVGVDYAFMIEPYSPQDRHIIGVNFQF